MFGNTQPQDHGNKQIKFLLRQAFLPQIQPKAALDLFAGRGEIAWRFYQGFSELHCVEENPRSFAFLEKRFAGVIQPAVHLYRADNLDFLAERAEKIPGINLVDFDAYGSPNPQIKAFFQECRVTQPMLIFATDGGKLARLRGRPWHPDWYSAKAPVGPSAPRYHRIVAQGYELLIRQFWRELARAHAFRIKTFRLYWKQGRLVAYYGLRLEPA